MTSPKCFTFRLVPVVIVLFLQLTIANAQTSEVKAKPTGSISGHVTIGGKPADGIPVVAVAGETVNRRDAAGRTVTDSEGNYRLSGLGPGEYQVWSLSRALVAEPGAFPRYGFPYGSIQNVVLSPNEDVTNIDLKLVRGGVITGRITDSDNKPVVEERISLQVVDNNPGSVNSFPSGDEMFRTDDRGIYRIYGLPAGHYRVSAGADPAQGIVSRDRYNRVFYPDASDAAQAAIVELKEGGEAKDIDIRLGNTSKTYSVSGHVIDSATGVPVSNAGISFRLVRTDPSQGSPSFAIQSDDHGEFKFDGLAAGRYSVSPTSEFYGGNFYGDPVLFEVVDKDVTGLELKTVPGFSVSGVVAADGVPTRELLGLLPGLRLSVRSIGDSSTQVGSGGTVAVAPDGSFQVNGLRPGRVSIDVYSATSGFTRPSIARIEHDGIGITQGFDMRDSVSGLRVVVNYGTGAIRGTVKIEGDSSFSLRAYVNCRREGARDGSATQVDARGHFLIKNLAPGSYEVMLQIGGGTRENPYRPMPPQKQVVTVANGAESEVTFALSLPPKQGAP